jgi:hypothetical protein
MTLGGERLPIGWLLLHASQLLAQRFDTDGVDIPRGWVKTLIAGLGHRMHDNHAAIYKQQTTQ